MGSRHIKRRLLTYEKPWIRENPRPPKTRTLLGETFSAANYQGILLLQHCEACAAVNYPPRERCRNCLGDRLVWRNTDNHGRLLSFTELYHSQWEFFKRRVPWTVALVEVSHQILFTHLAVHTFKDVTSDFPAGTPIKVFTQSDKAYRSVLITVSEKTNITTIKQRVEIAEMLGLK